jgi:hypothetical protein
MAVTINLIGAALTIPLSLSISLLDNHVHFIAFVFFIIITLTVKTVNLFYRYSLNDSLYRLFLTLSLSSAGVP